MRKCYLVKRFSLYFFAIHTVTDEYEMTVTGHTLNKVEALNFCWSR